jgi:DNA-binding GntR family transcriptional regulator
MISMASMVKATAVSNGIRGLTAQIVHGRQYLDAVDQTENQRSSDTLRRLPQRNVLADDVYDIIREGLVTRRIPPGARLNLDQLARELFVSNTPVRQALARLEAEGLVTKEPYRGFSASPMLDLQTLSERYELRMMIEPATAASVAKHPTADLARRLDELCVSAASVRQNPGSDASEVLSQHDVDFHGAIAAAAGNNLIVEVLDQTLVRMIGYTLYQVQDVWEQSWDEHQVIVDAINAGDPAGAKQAMRLHLQSGYERARRAIS